jgi:hypothetical protein
MKTRDDLLLELLILVEQELPKYPLIDRFFGSAFKRFLSLGVPDQGRAIYLFTHGNPEQLEARLKRISDLAIVKKIFTEANLERITNANELDSRLVNLWAELRTIDQLHREGFTNIQKHGSHYDFDATLENAPYAIQVIRVNKEISVPEPYGNLARIRDEVREGVLSCDGTRNPSIQHILWERVKDKDSDFAKVIDHHFQRRLVIVTSDSELDDRFLRYYVCQCLAEFFSCPEIRYIDEISWLPNLGNGVLLARKSDSVKCLVDWNDRESSHEEPRQCNWHEVSLSGYLPPSDW